MKNLVIILIFGLVISCGSDQKDMKKIIFLHHSTGYNIWLGGTNRYLYKLTGKGDVQKSFKKYNRKNNTEYMIRDLYFPKQVPYGWKNYPFDYYNIWVKNAGNQPFMKEPTLEILTREYDVIILKHCFPVSKISEDSGMPDADSETKSIENYKLQYSALKNKMHEFTDNKFIIWTPAVNTKTNMTEDEAHRTRQFRDWIINEWDEKNDNIFVWDFYEYETGGEIYLAEKNASSFNNSHPSKEFSERIAPLFSRFIIDVIENVIE